MPISLEEKSAIQYLHENIFNYQKKNSSGGAHAKTLFNKSKTFMKKLDHLLVTRCL